MQKGFSLLEIVVSASILVILIGGSIAIGSQSLRNLEMKRAGEIIRGELTAAQGNTIAGTADTSWGVAFFPHSVTMFAGTDYASRAVAFDKISNFSNSIAISGPNQIIFTRPDGLPAGSAAVTITETDGNRTSTVSVNGAGSITVTVR